VLGAAAAGFALPAPARDAADAGGINAVLFVLVLATALVLPGGSLARVRRAAPRLAVTLAVSTVALPLLAWVASRALPEGPLRLGVLTVGVAPTEIAAVATTALAGGEAALTAVLLATSTLATVALAGPVLGLLAGGADVDQAEVLVTLLAVVVAPAALGLALRRPLGPAAEGPATAVATLAVAVLVWLVAGQAEPSVDYVSVTLALVGFLAASALVGLALGRGLPPDRAAAVLLGTSMRDFAVAGGIAAAAFGPTAAAPLGLYGVLVMVWGGAVAARRRAPPPTPAPQ